MLPNPSPYFAELSDPIRETKNKLHKLNDILMNEITGIPDILSMIDLTGALVYIDAMGCQKKIAKQIVDTKADYLLALKENHANLYDDVTLWLNSESKNLKCVETVEKGHGRIEICKYILSNKIDWLDQRGQWKGLAAVGRVESTRIIGETSSTEYLYYLCSFTDLERFAKAVRGHWAIENTQHWVLDVQFAEDQNRSHKDLSPENLALVRRMALNIVRMNGPSKQSLRIRKLRASLNDDYRHQLIFGGFKS